MKKTALVTVAVLAVLFAIQAATASVTVPQTPIAGKTILKYQDPLPVPPIVDARVPNVGTEFHHTMWMNEFQFKILPAAFYAALPAPPLGIPVDGRNGTLVWGYDPNPITNGATRATYLGNTIVAKRGVPIKFDTRNNLFAPVLNQYLTVDTTLDWANPFNQPASLTQPYLGDIPAVVHLHGGEVPSGSDGGPDEWFMPGVTDTTPGVHGPGYLSNIMDYPMTQEAATIWYHDHALGITRLNVYGGLAGFHPVTDPLNEPAIAVQGDFGLAIQDRQFDTNGQLFFPDGLLGGLNGPPPNPTVHPFWIPEFLGDVIVVNGKSWPFLNVNQGLYRFRFLNGSNARTYELRLDNGSPFIMIATDGGYLDAPATTKRFVIMPGERYEALVDFCAVPVGTIITMRNTAKTPFPGGVPADPQTVGQIMRITVTGAAPAGACPAVVPANLRPNNPIVRLALNGVAQVVPAVKRQLTLNENVGAGGPLELLLNNTPFNGPVPGLPTRESELPRVGSTELWEIINISADAHPIHTHLVQFQILSRQGFQVGAYNAAYNAAFTGGVYIPAIGPPSPYEIPNADGAVGGNPAIGPFLQMQPAPPEPYENGWKDTAVMMPGEVTRILVRWAPTDAPIAAATPGTNLFAFDPTLGIGYVWHCHILDHEDNEMMRPYKVQP